MEDQPSSAGVRTPEQNSVTTVEIRIRTLDSSNYTLRVDKDMPVPALKDHLATVVGVPSQDQRLICRGRVLKDDQLLSSYNVEDGHTLHLVARPPSVASAEEATATQGPADSSGASSRGRPSHVTHSLLLGTINIPEAVEGSGMDDLSRVLSAIVNSVGAGDRRRGVALMQVSSSGLPSSNVPAAATSTTVPPPERRRSAGQTSAESFQFRNVEVVPDALSTISQYLTRMEQAFADNGYGVSSLIENSILSTLISGSGQSASSSTAAGVSSRPLPTPASLGSTISRVQELLHGQASSAFTHLASQLENEAGLSDTAARAELQSVAVWSGNIMQQLGALLMELGRTTLTLRLGPSPAQAIVNSGPAVFVSPSGPNPMMVQPLPFQTGLPLGAFPLGTAAQGEAVGSGSVPGARNVSTSLNADDTVRRPFSHVPLFGTSLQHLQQNITSDSVLDASTVDGNAGQPEARQTSDAARPPSNDQESSEQSLGFLVQENGSVRLVPVRTRTATSVNIQPSPLFRGSRSPSEAVTVPVLGIRAQVHAHPWTQAVLQASEGQRPVGIVTIPVDVTTSRGNGQDAAADTGVDSASGANRTVSGETDGAEQGLAAMSTCYEQTTAEGCQAANKMDVDASKSQVSENADERSSRKRAGQEEATDCAESCMSTSPESEELQSAQGGGKRQKMEQSSD